MDDEIDFFSDVDPADLSDVVVEESEAAQGGVRSKIDRVVGGARLRLSRGDGSGDLLNADARLSSVVSESTPGAALELLRLNTPFTFPDLNASVMLVLPTVGDFGGLSRRSKDEARGTIINLIAADNIHAVVTAELLADDALGIVPDVESLARMEEISLLTDARYLYAVACEDVETGEVKVFSVPPRSQETAVSGKLFEQALAISQGQLDVTSVLDKNLIAAMLTIYRSAENTWSATEALKKAEDMNMEYLANAFRQGSYPTGTELVENLATQFPELNDYRSSGQRVGRHSAAVVHESAAAEGADVVQSEGTTDSFETVDAVNDIDVLEDDDVVFDDDVAAFGDEPDFNLEMHDTGVDDTDDAETEPDFAEAVGGAESAGTDEPAFSGPDFADTPPTANADTEAVTKAVIAATSPQIEALRSDLTGLFGEIQKTLAPPQRTTEGGHPIADGVTRSAEITVEPGSEFTYDQALEAAGRVYGDDDLGLVVDPQPFRERLVSPLPQVPVPRGAHTPWLGEQATTMADVLNEQLRKLHVDHEQLLYRQFMHLADLAAKEISWEFDPQRNPDSRWGRVYAAIESDREKIAERAAPAKLRAEESVREMWDARAELFVSDAAARARQEFEHRNGAHIEADMRKAGDQVIADLEAMGMMNLAELNESRRISARLQMDEKLSDILHSLEGKAADQQANETAAFEAALAAVTSYIEEHRKDDLLQADVTARKLETDARYEQLMAEAQAQIAAARSEADNRIAMMLEEMDRQREAHQRGLDLRTTNFEWELSGQAQRQQQLERRLEQSFADWESERRELQSKADARVEMAEKARDEAIADKETMRERDSRMATAAIVLVVLGAIVLVSLGILAGAFLI
ncbi:hypothetical protein [Gordonia sp. KTR9]|uniref:hypothetical protein n=1 Tax=Gordonia sp. KTR9 TaxID=337191 RepID=UPI0001DD9172|nr:hypothetical protein [Gordonia sp. KTR9]ADK68941.1 hypothetical protein KTR9_4860 [Gordonia sp. KTR9]